MKASIHNRYSLLIIDDEVDVLETFELTLNSGGFTDITLCQDSRQVLPILTRKSNIDVILLDLMMPHELGKDLLKTLVENYPEIPVIVITAVDDLDTAVECIKSGAFDYLVKPIENLRLISSVHRAIERMELTKENSALKKRVLTDTLESPEAFVNIATKNPAMLAIFQYIEAIASSPEPVLITGETGTGKELIANAIHYLYNYEDPFIAVNVAGLDDHSFSDTLFGHRKGAFTGADSHRDGLLKKASGGILFLDEIGDLNQTSQIKLLRLLQEREYFPLGSDLPQKSNVRILIATHRDLSQSGEHQTFRRDLYYRLQTHQIHLPPLRKRLEDLPFLVDMLLDRAAKKLDKTKPRYPKELLPLLKCYQFPGNIRELETIIFDAVSKNKTGTLALNTFQERFFKDRSHAEQPSLTPDEEKNIFTLLKELPTLAEASQQLIKEAIKRGYGNQTLAARFLGITQPALSRRLTRQKHK